MRGLQTIRDLPGRIGEEATLRGWVVTRRSSGKLYFLILRDGTAVLQCVVSVGEASPEAFAAYDALSQETAVEVRGTVRADRRAPGGVELGVRSLRVLAPAADFPISPKEHGTDFLMDHRHLWLRSSRQHAILRVRSELVFACREFLRERGFVNVDTPIFTPNACEGTTTLFETDYFGERAYLAQSGQLYNEATAMAFGRVYCFGPTFRAERSKTRRHLIEFWMIEPEVAFATLDDILELEEEFVCAIVARILDRCREELKVVERDTTPLERVRPPFARLSYSEAVERLRAKGGAFEWGGDFGAPDETSLSEGFDRPFFVHRFPSAVKAFYMKPAPEDARTCLSADLLAPEGYGEIIGGGEREDSLERLEKRIEEEGLPREAFEWYLDLRRYGSVPHSGFGMGIERALAWILGLPHVRETIAFPRMLHRLSP